MIIDIVARVGFFVSGVLTIFFSNGYLFFLVAAFGLVGLLREHYRWFIKMNEMQANATPHKTSQNGGEKADGSQRSLEYFKSEYRDRAADGSESEITVSQERDSDK